MSVAFGLALATIAMTGCDGDDEASSGSTSPVAELPTVEIPPERMSPFCEAISDLDNELAAAGPDEDTQATIISAYSSMIDIVPEEIHDDFLSVLAELQIDQPEITTTTSTTTSTVALSAAPTTSATGETTPEEVLDPDDTPTLRVNRYIQFACRDSQNNPGPPATEPDLPEPSSGDDA
jgi:hypothetical protein